MAIRKVTIFEFAPTADEIWRISKHDRDGYARYDVGNGLVSFLDTAHHAKPRPEIVTTYAGGKATNVARVLDRLLADEDELYAELITFLPPPQEGPLRELELGSVRGISLRPSTAAGIYVQCLQIAELRKVRPRFEVVDELEESGRMQTTRRCIEVTFSGYGDNPVAQTSLSVEGGGSLNFSPRILWSQKAADAVRSRVAEVARGTDFVVLAGTPPIWEAHPEVYLTSRNFYAKVIDALEPDCQVSIDTSGQYLHECLIAQKRPRFAFMNTEEFSELAESLGESSERAFSGTLLVHDERGCWVWDRRLPDGQISGCRVRGKRRTRNPFSGTDHFPSIPVHRIYSTIGAGDAMHAGFLKEWICATRGTGHETRDLRQETGESGVLSPESIPSAMPPGERLRRAVVYSQVVAAVAVSNEKATHGIDAHIVEEKFQQIWQGMARFT